MGLTKQQQQLVVGQAAHRLVVRGVMRSLAEVGEAGSRDRKVGGWCGEVAVR